MGETIGELIIPGTYIEVRAEGLIGVGGISTGNVGAVGTASRGPVDEVVILGSYAEALATFGAPDPFPANPAATAHLTLVRTLEQVFAGGASTVYAVRVASLAAATTMRSMTWRVTAGAAELFTLTATSAGSWANAIAATLVAGADGGPARLTLQLGRVREIFEAATASDLAREVNEDSSLVRASAVVAANAATPPTAIAAAAADNQGGPDGAGSMGTLIPEIADGLALLEGEEVNLVVIAGYGADQAGAVALAHLERTESAGHERIAVLGTRSDQLAGIAQDAAATSNGRIVLVAPGITAPDAAQANAPLVRLPPAYAAALVTGKLASLAPHVSLTNKDVAAQGLTQLYSRAEQKQLLQNRIMVLFRNLGFRALRGLTTDDGPFRQISVRRIVDYAKAGVRKGSNPYIGRLNNPRVRAALRATLDGFLAQMVQDEMLTGYTLDVSATRRQEIEGICAVTMTLQPTFSIDFIRVTMILQ
jgi:tail sheath protein